jgi:hypothetical protein
MKQNNTSIVIIILAVAAFLVIGGYLAMPKKTATNVAPAQNQNTNLNTPPAYEPPINIPSAIPGATTINYQNTQYGFNFTLPASWTGYSIVVTQWTGVKSGDQGEQTVATGPIISIRHPLWTAAVPRQDIPVMVFTIKQWTALQNDTFHIGAAPIGPSELGRNNTNVFALPARYNFAYPAGYEEVDTILQGKPLSAF